MSLRELYQQVIIDHGRHPRNFNELDPATHQKEGFNPLCGDRLMLYLLVQDDVVQEVSFQGSGCAISVASASLMTEAIKGQTVAEAHTLFEAFHQVVTSRDPGKENEHLGKLTVLAGVSEFPARVKCATLAWHTLIAALNQNLDSVSTE